MKRFLNKLFHRYQYTKNYIRNTLVNSHHWCVENKLYKRVTYETSEILLMGFFVWVAMFPFATYNPIWFIPCYGIIPWFALLFKSEWVKR